MPPGAPAVPMILWESTGEGSGPVEISSVGEEISSIDAEMSSLTDDVSRVASGILLDHRRHHTGEGRMTTRLFLLCWNRPTSQPHC